MKRRGLLAVFAALPGALMFWRKPTASMDVEWKKLQDVLRDVGLGGHDAVEREAARRSTIPLEPKKDMVLHFTSPSPMNIKPGDVIPIDGMFRHVIAVSASGYTWIYL